MNKTMFDKNLSTLLTFKGVEFNRTQSDMLYGLLKDDFTDSEFGNICVDICKTCDLYNKYPDPKLFYDRKAEATKDVLVEVGTFYVDDTIPEYKDAFRGLSFDESCKLGDAVWNWIYKHYQGEMISKQFVIDRIKQFNPKYQKYDEMEEITEISPDVKKLLDGAIKKIEKK